MHLRGWMDKAGEFGPENLAYKAVRKQGLVQALHDLKAQLHTEKLSIDEYANEDYDPNGPPPGPEFKPTMPKGTVRVDVSDVYDWYKLGQHISNMKGLGKHDFGQGPPSTILSFGDEDTEHKYIQDLEKTGLTTTDIDPVDPNQPKGMKRQKTDPAYNVNEAEPAKPTTSINFRTWQRGGVPKHSFVVTRNGKEIAYGEVAKDNEWDDDRGASVQEIVVHPDYRRKGFATKIYNEIERRFNYKLHPSDDVKPDGQEFWKARGNLDEATDPTYNVNETDDRKAAVLKIQKHLNKKYGANLDLDGKLGPLTLKSINKFMPTAKTGLADEPNKTTAVQGKKLKEASDYSHYESKIEDFVQSLNPDDVGVEEIGPYHVHFEGFTDECQQDAERRCNLPSDNPQHLASYDDVYKEVIRDFVRREGGKKPLKVGFAGYEDYPVIYAVFENPEPYKNPDAWNPKIDEASGYIPSAKEKNDPRFKTALTVDVRPNAIKKNAKAFGFKTSRAGIPPQARADGKIAEDLMREFKTFLGEQQEEMFPGYDEQHREKRLGNWLAKSWGVQNGKPQTFYHATTKDFDTFNTSGTGFASALGMAYEVERHGSFFAVDPKFAEGFIEDPNTGRVKEGGRVLPVHLSIQSPIDLRDNALSRMVSDEETADEFKANGIDLRSVYNHFYELERWELFDGPEGAEFVDNLQKLGFDGAIINEAIPNNSNAKSGQVWVAFSPNQVKSVYNRGSFSPDDNRLMREDQQNTLPKIGYHVTATKNLPIIQQNGIKADKRGNSYVWDSREMAEWFKDFQNDEGQDRTILKIDMSGLDANPDPEAEDMSEWSSRFNPGTNGGAWIISGPIPSDKIIG